MNEAIKLAIKGGFRPTYESLNFILDSEKDWYLTDGQKYRMLLDPLFWQALGKALGWEGYASNLDGLDEPRKRYKLGYRWEYEAMRCFLLIITGGDTGKLWKELLHDKN